MGFAADSAAVNMWRLAQEFWARNESLVPKDIFDTLEFSAELIECRLAEVRETGVYVRGSSQHLSWLEEKREQAREAGKKSAAARQRKYGSSQPQSGKNTVTNVNETRTDTERTPNDRSNETRTKSNEREPSVSDSSSSHTHGDHDAVNIKIVQGEGDPTKNKTLVFETRTRFSKEIQEIESYLAALYPGNLIPQSMRRRVPEMLIRCNGSVAAVREVLEDLWQHEKISTGTGLTGPRADYVTASIIGKFQLGGAE